MLLIALLLTIVSLGARIFLPGTPGLVKFVDLNVERSFPTWYSSLGLAASALLLGAISWVLHRSNRREYIFHWIFLSVTFAFLSADEIVGIHESMNGIARKFGHFAGYLGFPWVMPASVGVAIFGAAYLRFLASLQVRCRNQFLVSGGVFVLGAIGMEMIGAKAAESYTRNSTAYLLCYNLEELLELSGIALFITTLIEHLAVLLGPDGLHVRFCDK